MTHPAFAMGRLMELYMWNRPQLMSSNNMRMVSYASPHAAKALAEAPLWLLIEKYCNTTMQQNNIWSIAFEACIK
jgi:hypothetical protein